MFNLVYTNRNGKIIRLTLNTWDDVEKWTNRLDARIEKGTCGGYNVSKA